MYVTSNFKYTSRIITQAGLKYVVIYVIYVFLCFKLLSCFVANKCCKVTVSFLN